MPPTVLHQVPCLIVCGDVRCPKALESWTFPGNGPGIAKLTFFRYYMRMTVHPRTLSGQSQFVGLVPQ